MFRLPLPSDCSRDIDKSNTIVEVRLLFKNISLGLNNAYVFTFLKSKMNIETLEITSFNNKLLAFSNILYLSYHNDFKKLCIMVNC